MPKEARQRSGLAKFLKLDPIDFEPRSVIDGSGWPFPKTELTRYYERALELEGLGGVTRQDEALWREIGLAIPKFPGL